MSQNPQPEEQSADSRVQERLEHGLQEAVDYSRILLPVETNLSQFDGNTRAIISEFLKRILENGDSYKRHKALNYRAFHSLQLDLLNHIIYCERKIQSLRARYHNSERVEKLRQRRRLLRLLGSSIAWLLLEFDAAYIRAFCRGHDPGFIVGKAGSLAEVAALVAGRTLKDRTLLLHHLTSCLRVGDMTLIEGPYHYPIEIKMDYSNGQHKPGKRERRQKGRGDMLWEYFATQRSTKLMPGITAIRTSAKKRDVHHWDALTRAFLEARKEGHSLQFAEDGIAYGVCHTYEQIDSLVLSLTKSWGKTVLLYGSLHQHVIGLPRIMPFTLYKIPFELKIEIMFEDSFAFGFVDLNGVCNTLTKRGVEASWQGNGIKINVHGEEGVMGSNLLDRLRYECISTETLKNYAYAIPKSLFKMSVESNEKTSVTSP